MPLETSPAAPAPTHGDARPAGQRWPQLRADTTHLLIALPLGLVAFVLCITLFLLGVGLMVTVIGLPVLTGALLLARGLADLERLRLPAILGRPVPRPRYRSSPDGSSLWRRWSRPIADRQSWFDLLHAILNWIPATIGFVIAVIWWSGGLGGLFSFAWVTLTPHEADSHGLPYFLGLPDTQSVQIVLYTAIGGLFLLTLPQVLHGTATATATISATLLSDIAAVQNRISGLTEQRDSAVSAEATAMRRLERDIHDGPQQRLVRLAMDLARAQRQVRGDPSKAEATIGDALDQTRETLNELRALSRGIAPPILTDRGLSAALTSLAGRCTVPVALFVPDSMPRLAAPIETAAYFVAAEALANTAKHSEAKACVVTLSSQVDQVTVSVLDDGVGGAHLAKGHGLTGLADRVRAVGGTLVVTSPTGGPTEVRAELPCG